MLLMSWSVIAIARAPLLRLGSPSVVVPHWLLHVSRLVPHWLLQDGIPLLIQYLLLLLLKTDLWLLLKVEGLLL